MLDQQRDVAAPVAQRRNLDRQDAQPVEQILPERAVPHHRREVAIGRGDDAHVGAPLLDRPDGHERRVLDDPQQLRLQRGAHVAHLVEEQRPPVGRLEEAAPIRHRAGEGAAHVAEEPGFEQRILQGRAVLRDERAGAARRQIVDRTGDEVLAGAVLPGDQHRGIRTRDAPEPRRHAGDRPAPA
ncbi:MAG: hypothetical protein QME96_15980, partial [Myxococcota bacterium]|nr:hypothetical protein [Myxococcota bacterium]